ncbi:hypothetical protein AC1031_011305 [Aphanomyces cochlioides]|nr:hypothetical protein AC1031_011305 [Aphanomyces cochlioides]
MEAQQASFAKTFWATCSHFTPDMRINVDETAVHYDMPPIKTLARKGGSSKVDTPQKHSDRIPAVLSVRSNDEKLPILFILKGAPGGQIDRFEMPKYPPGHIYIVQENAWMDARVWAIYLRELLLFQICCSLRLSPCPSALPAFSNLLMLVL